MRTIVIRLEQKDIGQEQYICKEIGRMIEDGYTSGINSPVRWSIESSKRVKIN